MIPFCLVLSLEKLRSSRTGWPTCAETVPLDHLQLAPPRTQMSFSDSGYAGMSKKSCRGGGASRGWSGRFVERIGVDWAKAGGSRKPYPSKLCGHPSIA